jgi:rare lipoprotein A (peptidoglycan hydrolase)
VRRPRIVAGLALIAVLAAVAVPASVESADHRPAGSIDAPLLRVVDASWIDGTTMSIPTLDPAYRSAGALDESTTIVEPALGRPTASRPDAVAVQPQSTARVVAIVPWHADGNVSWYGPGFYGKRTACGYAMTESLVGVAHRTLPCGTKVTFRNLDNGRTITVPVVDRGPYVDGRTWDLTGGLCTALDHCYTGPLAWKLA